MGNKTAQLHQPGSLPIETSLHTESVVVSEVLKQHHGRCTSLSCLLLCDCSCDASCDIQELNCDQSAPGGIINPLISQCLNKTAFNRQRKPTVN